MKHSLWKKNLAGVAAALALLPTIASAGPGSFKPGRFIDTGRLNPDLAIPMWITMDPGTGVVTITGTGASDVVTVTQFARRNGPAQVRIRFGDVSKVYPRKSVSKIVFRGENGDDRFTNNTSIPSEAEGNNGDDRLVGGSANDLLIGGYGKDYIDGREGHDTILGSGGSDSLHGGPGNDDIRGHGGRDYMRGNDGNDRMDGGSSSDTMFGDAGADRMYGSTGNDKVRGNAGMDTIVTVGGGIDNVDGGGQWDYLWVDPSDLLKNVSSNEKKLGYVNKVDSFHSVTVETNSSFSISKELLGQDLVDPLSRSKHYPYCTDQGCALPQMTNFADRPLFATSGPSKNDIFQGSVGDCYFVAALSIVADSEPEHIRKLVVDLGDGTYAVRFYRGGKARYVRVDGDLYVPTSNQQDPLYAGLGVEDSVWVPVVEKAYAVFRKSISSYDSIAGGNASKGEKFRDHLGLFTDSSKGISDGLTKEQIIAWHENGAPNGPIKNKIEASALDLLEWIQAKRSQGAGLLAWGLGNIRDSTPITAKSWRRAQHAYMVDRVTTDGQGKPTGLVLRDPHGYERTLKDLTRIHFCIGRAYQLEGECPTCPN